MRTCPLVIAILAYAGTLIGMARAEPVRPHQAHLIQVQQPSADDAREALRARLMTFVTEDYLGNAREGHENFGDLFAEAVDYYGRPGTSRARVLADKRSFYRRWPIRRYDYEPGSLTARPGPNDSVELMFRYTYEVSNGTRSARGIGTTTLGLILLDDGRYQIVKETGGVIRRTGGS